MPCLADEPQTLPGVQRIAFPAKRRPRHQAVELWEQLRHAPLRRCAGPGCRTDDAAGTTASMSDAVSWREARATLERSS